MTLRLLPPKTATLLKSTQVITSVSTVVKELVENAIDAGANNIEVKLEYHGMGKIEVKDDGCGISKEDAQFMCLPSYTSKIREFSDLEELHSYGFRGEALHAICCLADVTITTRTESDDYAMAYTMNEKGEVKSRQPSHLPKGTVVSVAGLFRSLPVRRELMQNQQRAGEELRRAEAVVKALALVHPQLRATFSHNKCLVWQKSAVATVRQSLLQVVGHRLVGSMDEHRLEHAQFTAMLMLPKKNLAAVTEVCQSSADCMMVYINQRPVRYKRLEKLVTKHLSQFYHQFPTGKHPTFFASIVLPPAGVDVNVEPNKTRVFLADENVLLSRFDEFLNFHYEPKLLKTQAVKNQKSTECENSEEGSSGSEVERLVKRPKIDSGHVAKCVQFTSQKPVRTAYKMLQVESNAILQRMRASEAESRVAEYEEVKRPEVAGMPDPDQDAAGVDVLASLPVRDRRVTENVTPPSRPAVDAETLHPGQDGSWGREPCEVLNGAEVKDEVTAVEIYDDVAQQLNSFTQDVSSCEVTFKVLDDGECLSQFFRDVDSPVDNSNANGAQEAQTREVPEHGNAGCLFESITNIGQKEEEVADDVTERKASADSGSSTTCRKTDVTEQEFTSTWDVMASVCNSALEGCDDPGRLVDANVVRVEQTSDGDVPRDSAVTTEKLDGLVSNEARPEGTDALCRPVSQSLWEAADAAAGFFGNAPAVKGHPVGEGRPGNDVDSRSLCKNAQSSKAELWSRGNVVGKDYCALKGGAQLARPCANLNDSIQSASSQMGCKELSAFTKFSRVMRPKILDENPGIAFTKVAGLLVSRWRELPEEERARYEDTAARVDQERRSEQDRRPAVPPKARKSASKDAQRPRDTLHSASPQQQKLQFPATSPAVRKLVKTEMVPFTVDHVREHFNLRSTKRVDGAAGELRLLGQLKPSGSWLYVRGKELGLLRHWGLQEQVLHHRLMSEHRVPTRPLDDKLRISQSDLGLELWELLSRLDRRFCSQTCTVLLCSPAIDRNGFKIEVLEGGDKVAFFMTCVASVVRFYGLADLRETLQLVQLHGSDLSQLRHCRPLKIANYLRCEAVRMTQQSPHIMDRDTLLDLLRFWDFHMGHEEALCLHHKPMYVPIYSLNPKGATEPL